MKKIKLRREVKIGIFTLGMILLLYWGINFIKGTDLIRGTNTYYATYEQVTGLKPASAIVIKGFKVGVVQRMFFDPQVSEKIVIELRIKSRFRIPDDSKARIYSDGLMGGKAIEIDLGSSPKFLHKGDTLHTEWDQDLLEMAGSEFEYIKQKANALVNQINATLGALNTILTDNSGHITTTLGNVAKLSGSLEDVVSSEAADLKNTLHNLNALSKSLATAGPKLESSMGNLDKFSGYLASPKIPNAVDELSASLTEFNGLLERVNSGQGTVGKLMKDETLYDSLTVASSNLALLLEDLKANPKRYVHFSLFGGGKNK